MPARAGAQGHEPSRPEAGAVDAVEEFGLEAKKGEKRLSYSMHRPGTAAASELVDRLTSKDRRHVRFEDGEGASSDQGEPREKGG